MKQFRFQQGEKAKIAITDEIVMILTAYDDSYKVRMKDYNVRTFFDYELRKIN
jgi:hypothetical protein